MPCRGTVAVVRALLVARATDANAAPLTGKNIIGLIATTTRFRAERLLADREPAQHEGNGTEGEQRATQIVRLGFLRVGHERYVRLTRYSDG